MKQNNDILWTWNELKENLISTVCRYKHMLHYENILLRITNSISHANNHKFYEWQMALLWLKHKINLYSHSYYITAEYMADVIKKEILDEDCNITHDDIPGGWGTIEGINIGITKEKGIAVEFVIRHLSVGTTYAFRRYLTVSFSEAVQMLENDQCNPRKNKNLHFLDKEVTNWDSRIIDYSIPINV